MYHLCTIFGRPHAALCHGIIKLRHYTLSIYELGYIYELGLGVKRNKKKALLYYKYAALHNYQKAIEKVAKLESLGISLDEFKNKVNELRNDLIQDAIENCVSDIVSDAIDKMVDESGSIIGETVGDLVGDFTARLVMSVFES